VANTAAKAAFGDVGEGDGVYSEATGLKNFYSIDPHSIIRGWSNSVARAP